VQRVHVALVIVRGACRRDYKNEAAVAVEKSTTYGNTVIIAAKGWRSC
jgi:hypothetical protein